MWYVCIYISWLITVYVCMYCVLYVHCPHHIVNEHQTLISALHTQVDCNGICGHIFSIAMGAVVLHVRAV